MVIILSDACLEVSIPALRTLRSTPRRRVLQLRRGFGALDSNSQPASQRAASPRQHRRSGGTDSNYYASFAECWNHRRTFGVCSKPRIPTRLGMLMFCALLRLAVIAFVYALSVQDAREIVDKIASNGTSQCCCTRVSYFSVTLDDILDGKRNSDEQMPVALSFNCLKELSPDVGHLTSLRELQLSRNFLTSLPDAICRLENLEVMRLNMNSIKALPECIGELRNLTSIHAYGNQLTSLPDSIRNLRNLRTLDISHNNLTALPSSICEIDESTKRPVLPNLRELYLYGNKINRSAVLHQCAPMILDVFI